MILSILGLLMILIRPPRSMQESYFEIGHKY